jgi:hypothetical protein
VRLDAGIGIASTTADLGDVIESGARVKVAREPDRRAAADAIAATVRSGGSPKPVKHRHSCAIGAGHLDDERGLDLISGLGALDEWKIVFLVISSTTRRNASHV